MGPGALPLFHLYGDPPDDQAFDFIHIETIASRSAIHDWVIRAHRHATFPDFTDRAGRRRHDVRSRCHAIRRALRDPGAGDGGDGFRFRPDATNGWVMTFTEDVAEGMGDRRGEALARLKVLATDPVVTLGEREHERLSRLAAELNEEAFLARLGFRIAMRGLLALVAVEVARLAAGRARAGTATVVLEPTGATVQALRKLLEEHFQTERQLAFYADKLAMTVDRLNDHVKRATGVTAGHLIRHRVLTEAKRQLVFTSEPIHEIAYGLAFSDPSHFARFFRKQTGTTPTSSAPPAAGKWVQEGPCLGTGGDKVNKGLPLRRQLQAGTPLRDRRRDALAAEPWPARRPRRRRCGQFLGLGRSMLPWSRSISR